MIFMPLLQKAFRLYILVPVIALMAIFVAPTTTFAHAASDWPSRSLRSATVTSLCPDCEGQNPWHYLHNGDMCASNARIVASVDIQGGIVELFYSDACGTNWAQTLVEDINRITNANITRADGAHFEGTWYPSNTLEVWSPMVYAPVLKAKACGSTNTLLGGCTVWV